MTSGSTPARQTGALLSTLLLCLTIFGPLSMDLYLPVLPALTSDLDAATSVAQLTMTACLLGLAAGQVVAGPVSDRYGRRKPALVGIAAYGVMSALCAVSPSIEVLIAFRFLQGLAGAVGIVIAQAAGRDIYDGGALVRYYGKVSVVAGLAAIIGPLIGGQIARFTDWRGLFLFLAFTGVVLLIAALIIFRETLPADRRTTGGLRQVGQGYRRLLADRLFVGATVLIGFVYAAVFAYLSGATYVLQGIYGLSPQEYSFVFGLTSFGFMVFGYLAGRAAEAWSARGTIVTGLVMCGIGAVGLLVTQPLQLSLTFVIPSLFLIVSGAAVVTPPATSLALTDYPELAGTAASLLGVIRYAVGGVTAPLVGLAGDDTVLPLGIVTVVSVAIAVTAFVLFVVRVSPGRDPVSLSEPA